jgi:hypothetical protein
VDEFALAQNQQPINREAALALDLISKLGKMWHPNKPIGVMSRRPYKGEAFNTPQENNTNYK